MDWLHRIAQVQHQLKQMHIQGWLLYHFQDRNPLARDFLQVSAHELMTRRAFYWIPADAEPVLLLHQIELHTLAHLPGKRVAYTTWEELHSSLRRLLCSTQKVAMEYSPLQQLPALSYVDAGLVDLVRSFGVEVISSGDLMQPYMAVLSPHQLQTHLQAAHLLDQLAEEAWELIRHALTHHTPLSENDVRQFLLRRFAQEGYVSEGAPICAVNANSANPHFDPDPHHSKPIRRGDFVLIDLWCKQKHADAIYADITRVAFADSTVPTHHQKIFAIVKEAQNRATEFVKTRYARGEPLHGYEVDRICRSVIEEKGYGAYFTHRTGHNIYTKDHGPGAHLDSFETYDTRQLIPGSCFSIEPGIYLPGEFGIRLEYDLYLGPEGQVQVTGGSQEELLALF